MEEKLKPLMQKRQIKAIEKQLLEFKDLERRINILEWGSGGSTVCFTQFLKKNYIEYDWLSLEYNKNWYEKVKVLLNDDSDTEVVLFDVGNSNLRQPNLEMNEYVKYPATLNKQFDFILVDGRKRRRCLIEAKNLLSSGGVVFLHDAHRKYYQCALKNYPDSFFVCLGLWRGKNESVGCFREIFNKLVYFWWKPIIWLRFWMMTILRKIRYKFLFLQKLNNKHKNIRLF